METRRSFIKKAGILSGASAMLQSLPASIQKAFAINPDIGSDFYDAEHIVFLMQENRSFDHTFGTLQGVRGFRDPRAIKLPDDNLVWMQTNQKGETYMPFAYDLFDSKITWMGSLPHGWPDQVDARNGGRYDNWLIAKDPGEEYDGQPLTLGYYSRKDIPFYYALADSFTICDHNFCSSLTGTTPNRMYFWSGTIREKMEAASQANVWNHNADHGAGEVSWKTYPERLEENNISWKVYQNELYLDIGLEDAQPWLDNFGDNPLEYFTQYNARLHPEYIAYLPQKIQKLEESIHSLQKQILTADSQEKKEALTHDCKRKEIRLAGLRQEQIDFTLKKWDELSEFSKNIHRKAFDTNRSDPHYHKLTTVSYKDGDNEREINIPKGDILKNFREDVNTGKLPTVSWIAAPENFSDHPTSAWFGAWYISEVMDILTHNPEVWKKTILIITYDENDGYFDHIPPFAAPNPYKANTGKVSTGIDTTVEFVQKHEQSDPQWGRESNIGLGYRVPMIIASPWSRGGKVCSQVFDHTSSLQFLENFMEKKFGKKIPEENISAWRRTVCGNLTSAFTKYIGENLSSPKPVDKIPFFEKINNAQFKNEPGGFQPLSTEAISLVNQEAYRSALLPPQEQGIRDACPLPYELSANCKLNIQAKNVLVNVSANHQSFGKEAVGAPFYVYAKNLINNTDAVHRDFAVKAGDSLSDEWNLKLFIDNHYHLSVYGPNGFFRCFKGNYIDPDLSVNCMHQPGGDLLIALYNKAGIETSVQIVDNSYGSPSRTLVIPPLSTERTSFNLSASFGWYDFTVKVIGNKDYSQQFAGHVETGKLSKTDPLMGRVL